MISTKGRYAIRFMIDLAEQPEGKIVPLDDTARRQDISKKYLEIIVKLLVGGNLVKGISGKGGGYRLVRKAEEYTIYDILTVAEGSMVPVACLDPCSERCPRKEFCKTLPMWRKFNSMSKSFFTGITLSDLANGTFQQDEI